MTAPIIINYVLGFIAALMVTMDMSLDEEGRPRKARRGLVMILFGGLGIVIALLMYFWEEANIKLPKKHTIPRARIHDE